MPAHRAHGSVHSRHASHASLSQMVTLEGHRKPYRWIIFTIAVIIVAAILLLNLHRAPEFVRTAVPRLNSYTCPTSDCVVFKCGNKIPNRTAVDPHRSDGQWSYDPKRDANEYGLSLDQCDVAFPGLFTEIERQVSARQHKHITEREITKKRWNGGMIRLLVWEGQLYVVETHKPDIRRSRQFSTMLAINRALLASPNRHTIPNVEFVISIEDWTVDEDLPVWAYDRKAEQNSTWIMPDFGFWGWPEPGIGTYAEVRKRMADVEEDYPNFSDKKAKLFWRGAIVPSVAPVLRQHMVDQAEHQSWADLKVLNWEADDPDETNRVPIEDHCKYQYLINTEGRAWSGRLKYIQNCRSVIVAHKMEWIVPHEYLMVPSGPKQNFIQLERDFSDLREKMDYYMANPKKAEIIADNSAKTFRDRYLTPAAEACYWRKMIYGWGEVSFKPRFYEGKGSNRTWRGVPFDSYVLMRKLHWDPY